MSVSQRDAWKALKLAVDKFSQTTGAEVAVATTCLFEAPFDNYLSQTHEKTNASVYGHGSLFHQVKKGLELVKDDELSYDKSESMLKQSRDVNNSNVAGKDILYDKGHFNMQDSDTRSLSTSFRTLKLDVQPQTIKTGMSGTIGNIGSVGSSPDPASMSGHISRASKKKSKLKKSARKGSDDLEMGENLLFGEGNISCEEEDNDSDDSDEIEEGFQLTNRAYNVPTHMQRSALNAAYATSLPVNINLDWGQRTNSDNRSHFHDNRGPHPPLYNPSMQRVTQTQPTVIKADSTPQHDTIMASMQALARSVTDDSALIFGERPRPRMQTETFGKNKF